MEENDKKSMFLTPCRSVGLKRKSSTPSSPPFAPVDALGPRHKVSKPEVANVSQNTAAATNSPITNVNKDNSVASVSKNLIKTRTRSLGNALRKTPGGYDSKCKSQQSETTKASQDTATSSIADMSKDKDASTNSVTDVSNNFIKNISRSLGSILRRTPGSCNSKCKTQQSETLGSPCKMYNSNDNQDMLDTLKADVEDKKKQLSSLHASSTGEMSEACKLKDLTETWRSACQAALSDLLQHIRTEASTTEKQNMNMESLLCHLNIPIDLVHFDLEKDEFY